MTTPACDAFRELAPELALGIAVGDERAAALDHVAGCAACRRSLEDLTATVDALALAAPAVEPPSGFEVRALDAFDAIGRARDDERRSPDAERRPAAGAGRGRWLAVAAVVALLALATTALVQWRGDDAPPYSATSVLAGPIETADGAPVGRAWVDDGDRDPRDPGAELVVSLDERTPAGTYRVQCDYESGGPYEAGELTVGPDGLDRWSTAVSVATYDLRRVRLIGTTGQGNLEAEIGEGG